MFTTFRMFGAVGNIGCRICYCGNPIQRRITISLKPAAVYNCFNSSAPRLTFQRINISSKDSFRSSSLSWILTRMASNQTPQMRYQMQQRKKQKSMMMYLSAILILALGFGYASVPLYRIFCQVTSYGGTTQRGHDISKLSTMKKVNDRPITIRFTADTYLNVPWKFKPQQSKITVFPGETVLAFYTAKNLADHAITGIATYNVLPYDAGLYFNKVQCFCFEEQRLNPHEEVDMPVFFYIDPDFDEDPKMATVDEILLSYTFFEAKPGVEIPLPGFLKPSDQPPPTTTPSPAAA